MIADSLASWEVILVLSKTKPLAKADLTAPSSLAITFLCPPNIPLTVLASRPQLGRQCLARPKTSLATCSTGFTLNSLVYELALSAALIAGPRSCFNCDPSHYLLLNPCKPMKRERPEPMPDLAVKMMVVRASQGQMQ